jgi:hypothetical protein
LLDGFWPLHDWRRIDTAPFLIAVADTTPEDEDPEVYYGPQNERPKEPLNPWQDIKEGSWVLQRPSDPEIYPILLVKALTTVCRVVGHEDYGKFVMQYWEPQNAAQDHKLKYKDLGM